MSRSDRRRIRLTSADRLGHRLRVAALVGPFEVPPRTALVDALLALADEAPWLRIGLRLDAEELRWVPDPRGLRAWCEDAIVELPGRPREVFDRLVAEALPQLRSVPIGLVLVGDHVIQFVDHGLGDAALQGLWLGAVVAKAQGRALPAALARRPAGSATRSALLRAVLPLWRAFGALRDSRRTRREILSARADRAPHAVAAPVVDAMADGTIDPAAFSALRAALRERPERVTLTAALVALLGEELRRAGVAIDPEIGLVTDLRAQAGRRVVDYGNAVTWLGLAVPPGSGLGTVAASIARARRSRRAALVHLLAGIDARRVADTGTRAGAAPARRRGAHLVVSSIRIPDDQLVAPGIERLVHSNLPAQAGTILLVAIGYGDRLHLTANFDAASLDAAAVERAITAIAEDPVGRLRALETRGIAPSPADRARVG